MTHAQALNLLELSAAQAADARRVREAHARRRRQLASQLEAASTVDARAAIAETLAALDVAASMLQGRQRPQKRPAQPSKTASPPARPAPAAPASAAKPATPAPPARAEPSKAASPPPQAPIKRPEDWIAATPWSAIQSEAAGEFRSADEGAAAGKGPGRPAEPARPAPLPRADVPRAGAPRSQPTPAAPSQPPPETALPPKPERAVVTLALPDSVFDGPRRIAPDVPQVAIVRSPAARRPQRPAEPYRHFATELSLPSPDVHDTPNPVRFVPIAAAALVLIGVAGAAGWAWNEGYFDSLLQGGAGGSTADARSAGDPGAGDSGAGQGDPPDREIELPDDNDAPAPDLESAIGTTTAQRQEIEDLGAQLSLRAEELGGAAGIDWQQQLASADRAGAAGDLEEEAQQLARLHDTLRAQLAAAEEVASARQRLAGAGEIEQAGPLSVAAARHVEKLARAAEGGVRRGDFQAAAQGYEQALQARLRLPRDLEELAPAHQEAAGQHQRVLEAMDELDVRESELGGTASADAEQSLSASGPDVLAWLNEQTPATQLAARYTALAGELESHAQALERIASLRAQVHDSAEQLIDLEARIAELGTGREQLASWLEAGTAPPDAAAQEGMNALRRGDLEAASKAWEASAQEAQQRLRSARRVHDLLGRRGQVVERMDAEAPAAEERLARLESAVKSAADSSSAQASAGWQSLAAQLAGDRRHLQSLQSAAQASLPADAGQLPEHVQKLELSAEAYLALAPAIEALSVAEQRLLLLRELGGGSPAGDALPLPSAIEARRALARAVGEDMPISSERLASLREEMEAARSETAAAGQSLAEPAALELAEALAARQRKYQEDYGSVDLARLWQPEEPQPGSLSPAALAQPVAEALAAEANADTLRQELASGGIAGAQQVMAHVRTLDRATATVDALRETAEREDEAGRRRLHQAAAAGDLEQVEALLALGAAAAPVDGKGQTPLGIALENDHHGIAALLLKAGGKPQGWLEAGRPIIFAAAASPESLKLLLEHGAPASDLHRGETALHALAWQANRGQLPAQRQLEAAGILIEAGVDKSIRNRSGQTPAQLAASLGLRELSEFLSAAPAARLP